MLKPLTITVLSLAIIASAASGGTYYVSPTGTSGNPGTQASPWSLGKANSDLIADDTAILMDGNYTSHISPARSGVAGQPITYRAENLHLATFNNLTSGNAVTISNRSYLVIDGIASSNVARWVRGEVGNDHITITNCDFEYSSGFESVRLRQSGDGHVLTNNRFAHGDGDSVSIGQGKNHLIENNYFDTAGHTCMVFVGCEDSVFRNNTLENPDMKLMEIFGNRFSPDIGKPPRHIVVTDNHYKYTADFTTSGSSAVACSVSGEYLILRRNLITNCQSGFFYMQSQNSDGDESEWNRHNRMYNNVTYNNGHDGLAWKYNGFGMIVGLDGTNGAGDNVMVNNIFYYSHHADGRWFTGYPTTSQIGFMGGGEPSRNRFDNNNIICEVPGEPVFAILGVGSFTIAQYEATYGAYASGNIGVNPMMTDPDNYDATLLPGSPCIDAGKPLTTAASAGSGTVITVNDALYFTDGFGLIEADILRVGSEQVTIVSVDYGTNQITIDRSISWSAGDPVSITYNGSAPDIGIHEFANAGTIVGRQVFYNLSAWDGNNPAANASDDAAIATNKAALLPTETASFTNYTSYSKGINGIMVDIDFLGGTPTASDFIFRVGNDSNPGLWTTLAVTPTITVRAGAGTGGSDRVTIILPDGTAIGQWLEVTVKATSNTGQLTEDVFYFGNAIGDTGNSVTDAEVTPTDEVYVRNNPATLAVSSAVITHAADFNRDKKVGPTDSIIARNNGTNSSTALQLMTAAVNNQPTVDAGPGSSIDISQSATLDGTVSDDGIPTALTTTWSKLVGPGTVTFTNASAVDTTATFSAAGTYTLQLEAFDGEKTAADTVDIEVTATENYFTDDFEDNNLVGWTNLAGSFETFQFIGQSNYEVHALAASSRMRADLTDTNLDNTVYMSFKVRHTGGAEGGSNTGNKAGHIWFVDSSGAGFGLYIILSQTGAGLLDIYTTTDDGATSTYVGNYTAPPAIGGNDLKQIELVYDRVADQVECFYEGSSIGTIAVSSAYRDFTRVAVSLADMYISFGDPVIHIWGQLDVDDIIIANTSITN